MRTLKRIEIIAVLLFVTVIIFTSFFGVYKKEDFRTVNLIKGYDLGMQFTKTRELKMTVSTAENANTEEALTEENYNLSKEILKDRLKGMNVGEYKIELNKETGEIIVKLQENDEVEEILHHLEGQGEFTIIDKETEEVLLNNSDVEISEVVIMPIDELGTSFGIYLEIEFNNEGAKKLEEISKTYVKTTEEQENEEGEFEEVDTTKYVSVVLDGTTYSSTYFGETMSTGILYVPITEASDNEAIEQYRKEIEHIVTIINSGNLPIVYEYSEETVDAQIDKNIISIGILVPAALLLIACIVLVVKFKSKGFIATFLQIGYIALLLLAVRYTDVVITVEGVVGIVISVILNYILVYVMLNNLKKKDFIEWGTIGKFAIRTIPVYIIVIILAFNSLTRINSLGMTLVWGSIVLYIYNLTITKTVLKMLTK